MALFRCGADGKTRYAFFYNHSDKNWCTLFVNGVPQTVSIVSAYTIAGVTLAAGANNAVNITNNSGEDLYYMPLDSAGGSAQYQTLANGQSASPAQAGVYWEV